MSFKEHADDAIQETADRANAAEPTDRRAELRFATVTAVPGTADWHQAIDNAVAYLLEPDTPAATCECTPLHPETDPNGPRIHDSDCQALAAPQDALWAVTGRADACPMCDHDPSFHKEPCEAEIGYSHMNGSHDCGCPLIFRGATS